MSPIQEQIIRDEYIQNQDNSKFDDEMSEQELLDRQEEQFAEEECPEL